MAKDSAAVADLYELTISKTALKAIFELLSNLCEDHIRMAESWVYHDQRRDYIGGKPKKKSEPDEDPDAQAGVPADELAIIQGVLVRYWSNDALRDLFPNQFARAICKLQALLSEANAAIERNQQQQRLAEERTQKNGGTMDDRKRKERREKRLAEARLKLLQLLSNHLAFKDSLQYL